MHILLLLHLMPKMCHLLLLIMLPLSDSVLALAQSFNPLLSNVSDQHSLLKFKAALTDDPYNSLGNWNPELTFCNWTGVTCSLGKQRVVSLNLTGKRLEGFISPHLGNLSFLTVLDLSQNALNGSIPPQLGYLLDLKVLQLRQNRLKGPIPNELGLLQDLKVLNMGRNNLTGTIPHSLSNISTLIALFLQENNLHGRIPVELSVLKQLSILQVRQNQLVGSIPIALSNCTALWALSLSNNQLSGQIPWEFGAKLTNLQQLYLWGNHLTGSIPLSLANCSSLTQLQIEKNKLTGIIPTELGNLLLLERLYLNSNQFVSGSSTTLSFLTALTNCSFLQELGFSSNHLTGVLPISVAHLSTKISLFSFGNNRIRGNLPQQIGNLTNLTLLELDNNLFSGNIPQAFKRLQKLERLYMRNNKLQGSIPREIGELKRLGELSLDQNMLSGQIPDSFGNLQQLRYLQLNQNQLSGNITASLGECQNLLLLDLSHNSLTGNIPPEVAGLPYLQFYLNLSSNSLQGSLPPQIGKLTMINVIDLSANKLTGSNSNFTWRIGSLQDMDLSSNNLSGKIPVSLEKLKMLHQVNFSFNNLKGEVPNGGVFPKLTIASFIGNPGLCGPLPFLAACPTPASLKHKSNSLLRRVIITVATVSAFILCCIIVGIFWSRNILNLSKDDAVEVNYSWTSHQELINATSGFSQANLVGVGSFGSVYRGVLNDGTVVAVKVLKLQNEAAHESFNTECEVLGEVRHRNLVKIIASCSTINFKALVYPFMSKGSLEKCLYSDGLTFGERLNIAIDIAHAMAYLHHDSFVEVVHCDLKPSNVLMDDNMTAHVNDFGIARLTCANSIDSFTTTLALQGTIGYIPPEYGFGRRASTKGDVYSYGILLLELLTRKKPTDDMFVEGFNLQKWVSTDFPNRMAELVDGDMLSDANGLGDRFMNSVIQLMQVGLMCARESPEQRPNMRDVVWALERIRGDFLVSSRVSIV
eukprot:Gb_38050 [translate_table: standard]